MRSLRGVLALGSSQKSPQLPFLDEAGKKYCAVVHLALYTFARTHTSLFSLLNMLLCRDLKYKEVSYLPITVLTQERQRAAVVWWDFFFFFFWMCCHLFFILFSCAAEITHLPICKTYPPTGDSEVHQPATGRDLHKAACVRGTFCVVDDWDFEGSIHLFLLSG